MLHRLPQLLALLPGVAASQLNLYPTAAFVQSAATLCTDLQVDLGQQLKLQHFVAALEATDAMPGEAVAGVKYLQGEAVLEEHRLNFTVKQVFGAWPFGADAVQLRQVHLREEAKLQNAYHLRCALHASEFLQLTKPLNLEVRTDKVYDWFRYVGYVRWAEHMMQQLLATAKNRPTSFVDLGGGSGWLSMLVKAVVPVVQVVYTEISRAALEEATESFRANGLKVETLQGDLFDALQGRRIDFIFSYPPQVPPGNGTSRGSPEVALATPQGQSEAHFLRRFCRELVLEPQGVAWLGVTWELLQQTLEDCCLQGWNVTIPEAFRLDLAIPGTLLELRVADGPAACDSASAAAQCAACPEWLSRVQRSKAAEGGHATAQTKMGIELMREAAESHGDGEKAATAATLQRQAIKWYKRAAKQGEPIAATRLAFLYLTGDGLRKDHSKGLKLLWQAALQGEASAMFGLAETFALDAAVDDALKWYRRAAAGGWREAKRQLGLFLLSRGMASEEAEEMLREAAVEGDPRALQLLKDYFPSATEL